MLNNVFIKDVHERLKPYDKKFEPKVMEWLESLALSKFDNKASVSDEDLVDVKLNLTCQIDDEEYFRRLRTRYSGRS